MRKISVTLAYSSVLSLLGITANLNAACPPTLGLSFAGASLHDAFSIPPDTMGAVGPNHFMEVINGNVSVFRKTDGVRLSSQSLSSFFSGSGASVGGDPRVIFDHHSERWIAIASNFQHPEGGRIAIAVSLSKDPTEAFFKTSFQVATNPIEWADYPTLGVNVNGIYISAIIGGGSNTYNTIWAIDKAPLIADPPNLGTVTAWRGPAEGVEAGLYQPAHTYGLGSEYIISSASGSAFRVYKIDPPLTAPTMSTWTIPAPAYTPRISGSPALGSFLPVSTGGARLMMSVYRDGSLWTTHCIDVNGRAAIRWYQINPVSQTVIQWGNVTDPSLHFYYPSMMVNSAGQVVLAFSGSDATHYVSAYYTGRRAADAIGTMAAPELLKAGEAPYNGPNNGSSIRIGDYSYTTLDPVDQLTFWTIQEYAETPVNLSYEWGTWVGVLSFIPTELAGSTCQDGLDNDCDGYGDCDDGDCASDSACRCYDNGGNSPVVCVKWAGGSLPEPEQDFRVDFDPVNNDPGVTFVTGNNGWKVWSMNRSNNVAANLWHIKIDPTLANASFSLTIAHGNSPGAANISSMVLTDSGWTGVSNLSGGGIAGHLEGDLVLQGTAGISGAANFTIGGNVTGDMSIPTVSALQIGGAVSADSTITLGGFLGSMSAQFNSTAGDFGGDLFLSNELPRGAQVIINGFLTDDASVNFNGHDLAGSLSLYGGSAEQSTINIGTLVAPSGQFQIYNSTYSGTATLANIENGGVIEFVSALEGNIIVDGDWNGALQFNGTFGADGSISIGGNLSSTGQLNFVLETGEISGDILIGGNSAGSIGVGGDIDGNLQINGVMSGELSASNISASQTLPLNIQIGCGIGSSGKLSGQSPVCPPTGNILSSLAQPPHGTRDGRQPYPMGQSGTPVPMSSRQGIGSPNPDARDEDKIIMTLNNSGLRAISHDCWSICETFIEPVDTGTSALSPNKIACLAEQGVGSDEYQIKLERPISAKNWTTIKYDPGATRVSYASLPGNINGDNYVNSTDMLWRIDCMNGITSHCGTTVYTQDLDHSGAFATGPDYGIAWVDLWNGNGNFILWQQKQLPANSCIGGGSGGPPCPVLPCGPDPGPQMAMMGGGGGAEFESMSGELLESGGEEALQSALLEGELIEPEPSIEDQNAEIADWVIGYLKTANPADSTAYEVFELSMEMVSLWIMEFFNAEEKLSLSTRLGDEVPSSASEISQAAAAELVVLLSP